MDREAQLRDLAEFGYVVIEDALTLEEVAELREYLVTQAAREIRDGTAHLYDDGCNQRVFSLLNKGDCFVRLAEHPLGLEFADHVLGPKDPRLVEYFAGQPGPWYLLSNCDANIAGPGGREMFLHNDQLSTPPPWHAPLVLNIAWMLDDFTEENGATRVVPGSHRCTDLTNAPTRDAATPVCGRAGSALVFEGRLWHQTGANVTADQQRHAVFTYYCAPWLRTQENYFVSLNPDVLASASPVLRRLLGYEPYLSLGSIDGIAPRPSRTDEQHSVTA